MDIDKRYKVPLVGVYNREVFECPKCGKNILHEYYEHICGIADANIGIVSIKECPKCFTKFYSHLSRLDYSILMDVIKKGENLHFKPLPKENK
jgi:hypothetical protein